MNLGIDLCGVALKNPVMTASGTFGSGEEYSEFVDLNKLGAVVTKGVANVPWEGNPTPRVAEVYGGMLNAIGLQNPGIDLFIDRDIPFLKKYDTKIIVNVCGHTTEEYIDVVERLSDQPVDLLEINISCPNVKEGGIAFGQNPKMVEEVTKEMKRHAKQPVIMKLSPNVTDITEMARAAEAGGADALSMINTITGMKIDIHRRCFALANRTGGMSGPAVHPVAVRMVYQSAQAVKIPIIGMGGIQTAEDAIEMILAGATAVSVGTANFYHPHATEEIVDGIRAYMERYQVEDIRELIGDLTLAKLQNIFNSIIKRQENKVDPIRSKFGKIEKEEVSLEDKMSDLELYAGTHHYFSFRGLLERQSGKIQVIVTFLAILELMKTGVITIEQEHLFDDIQITSLIYEEQQADGETGSSD